ncbi:MAG: hypothetical protein KGI72_00310 [Patescibacteria group bacterium]|nr:hypothetical protein [Patescibacteria group bacterium]
MTNENRQSMTKMINAGEKCIQRDLQKLVEALGSYGFSGETSIELRVKIHREFDGVKEAEVSRTISLPFSR